MNQEPNIFNNNENNNSQTNTNNFIPNQEVNNNQTPFQPINVVNINGVPNENTPVLPQQPQVEPQVIPEAPPAINNSVPPTPVIDNSQTPPVSNNSTNIAPMTNIQIPTPAPEVVNNNGLQNGINNNVGFGGQEPNMSFGNISAEPTNVTPPEEKPKTSLRTIILLILMVIAIIFAIIYFFVLPNLNKNTPSNESTEPQTNQEDTTNRLVGNWKINDGEEYWVFTETTFEKHQSSNNLANSYYKGTIEIHKGKAGASSLGIETESIDNVINNSNGLITENDVYIISMTPTLVTRNSEDATETEFTEENKWIYLWIFQTNDDGTVTAQVRNTAEENTNIYTKQ